METRVARQSFMTFGLLVLSQASGIVALACDGPRAGELIEHNRFIVNAYGLAAVLILISMIAIYFIRRRIGIVVILFALLVGFFHPFWHYGGGGGDCGRSMVELAKHVTLILAGILILQVVLWRLRRARMIASRA